MGIRDHSQIVLVVVGVILLGINIFLIVENVRLKAEVEQSKLMVTEEGYKFSELKMRGLDGSEETIDFSDGKYKTILLVFNTTCKYCLQEYPYWKELAENVDPNRWRIVAVTSEDNMNKIKNHVEEYKLDNIKVASVAQTDLRGARMLFTPMTLVIGTDGEVKKVWPGLWKKGFELPE